MSKIIKSSSEVDDIVRNIINNSSSPKMKWDAGVFYIKSIIVDIPEERSLSLFLRNKDKDTLVSIKFMIGDENTIEFDSFKYPFLEDRFNEDCISILIDILKTLFREVL